MSNTLENYIHVCFILDESGSMSGKEDDVVGGFKNVIDEQKALEVGKCSVSLFKFDTKVSEVYVGKNIENVEYIQKGNINDYMKEGVSEIYYIPGGTTALYDAIGTAITSISRWYDIVPDGLKPEKILVVVMTDGYENSSTKYNLSQVKEMITTKENQNWTFMFMGTDIRDKDYAKTMGFRYATYTTGDAYEKNYNIVNDVVMTYRSMSQSSMSLQDKDENFSQYLSATTDKINSQYDDDKNTEA